MKKGIAVNAFWVKNSEGAPLAPLAHLVFQEPLASQGEKENLVIKVNMVFLATLEQKWDICFFDAVFYAYWKIKNSYSPQEKNNDEK